MAHMQKFSGASAHHIIGHCFREESNHSLKYQTTSQIDTSRSHVNANLKMNIEALERKNEREYDEFEEYKDRQRKKVERLENALEHEKNKTWWDKLRGR